MQIQSTAFGCELAVPETLEEDSAYFSADQMSEARAYFDRYGYVVIRGLVPLDLVAQVQSAFDDELRRSRAPILRQKNMRYERNSFDGAGFLQNPIFNIQDIERRPFTAFKTAAFNVLASAAIARVLEALLGGPSRLIQSMYFQAPAGTWPHQDSYYQDSARGLGRCVAGWFALEDIKAEAGRFYVCPRSHVDMPVVRNEGANNFADGHENYKQLMAEAIKDHGFEIKAPYMAAGDVLFWSSLTVHGSLTAALPDQSRISMTAHYLRDDEEMLQFHSHIRAQPKTSHNGMVVSLLHDQNRLANRVMRTAAFYLPGPYNFARRHAIRMLIARRRHR
jgi:phytanoyl-CoA hydroxylase